MFFLLPLRLCWPLRCGLNLKTMLNFLQQAQASLSVMLRWSNCHACEDNYSSALSTPALACVASRSFNLCFCLPCVETMHENTNQTEAFSSSPHPCGFCANPSASGARRREPRRLQWRRYSWAIPPLSQQQRGTNKKQKLLKRGAKGAEN